MMFIDIDRLREDITREYYAAYFGGGYGAALIEAFDAEIATPEELIRMAQRLGMDLSKYEC